MINNNSSIVTLFKGNKVLPVMTVYDIKDAVEIARALMSGGFKVLEVTLRTSHAWLALEMIQKELPNLIIGVGTVVETSQLVRAKESGIHFAVSAFLNESLIEESQRLRLPYLPGVETASEVGKALQFGCSTLKLFPAEAANGIKRLKDFLPVFPEAVFIPTGGLRKENYRDYLALENVLAIGGGFMMPQVLITEKNWVGIINLSRQIKKF